MGVLVFVGIILVFGLLVTLYFITSALRFVIKRAIEDVEAQQNSRAMLMNEFQDPHRLCTPSPENVMQFARAPSVPTFPVHAL